METRIKNAGVALMRRSTGLQEMSLEAQFAWAKNKASENDVIFDASIEDLAYMKAKKLSAYKSMFIDDAVTGANLNRPGLNAFFERALNDETVSHTFINLSDRLARPVEPLDGMQLELRLRKCGITVVFSNRVGQPRQRGSNDFADNVLLMYEYTESGQFLQKHAQRVIDGQIQTARRGGWTGGRAPYGFARVLVDANGNEIQELIDGIRVRMPGCVTKIKPKDLEKIQTWLKILYWYEVGDIGATAIVQRLNAQNVPSPDAGRSRTDHGIKHKVSGKWCTGTVLSLIRNKAIIATNTYGVQSEGKYRRLGETGARTLVDSDFVDGEKPRVIKNADAIVIAHPSGFPAQADKQVFDSCQLKLLQRGQNQRGISRRRNPSRYPLATRIWDMSDGCGHIMYAKQSGSRPLYVCGRYMKTSGAQCNHNGVDGEAALKLTLGFLRQQMEGLGGRSVLRQALLKRARESKPDNTKQSEQEIQRLKQALSDAEADLKVIQRSLARAKDEEESDIVRSEWKAQKAIVERLKQQLELIAKKTGAPQDSMQRVDAALAIYDRILSVVNNPSARAKIPEMLKAMNIRLWLNFGSALKGTRSVRVLKGGIITTGAASPPIRPYGIDSDDAAERHGHVGLLPTAAGINEMPSVDSKSQSEGVSFTMVDRGDRIRTCDL